MPDETDMPEDSPLPWPQEGDQLIKADNDWWLNACIDNWNKDFWIYASGYKKAADILVDNIMSLASGTRNPIDYLVFPIVFLYRQYIELTLKQIIRVGIGLHKQQHPFPKHHELDELWWQARAILEKDSSSKEDLDTVESLIAELAAIDPSSEAFRYPIDKLGRKSIVQEQVLINVRHLKEIMSRLANFLDGCSDSLLVQLQLLDEIEDYYSP